MITESVITALIVTIPILTAQIFKHMQDRKEYQRSLQADNTANSKLDHITVLTNSTLTAANRRIDDLENQIKELLKVIKTDDLPPENKETHE